MNANNRNSSAVAASPAVNKVMYSPPASPNNGESSSSSSSPASNTTTTASTPNATVTSPAVSPAATTTLLSTPKKNLLDAFTLRTIREKLRTPSGRNSERYDLEYVSEPVNVIKDRYLISSRPSTISAASAAKTPASYRHLIDLTSSNLNCTDVFTEEQFLCKIINEPLHKVQRAYFQLKQDANGCRSTIMGHPLIRGVHDIVPLSAQRTYVIVPAEERGCGVYEDLHTYIRNKRRLCEVEAKALFHQICETVQVCHRNGIILRDLKLKRFYFIDEERTKLQYESLEGSMILDNPLDDTLSDKIGCPLYTAPELLCPNPTYRGKPADMWSLGVILYTMLVGQYPFYEKGSCNLITIIRHCHVQIPNSLSRSVRWLLLSLLRKNHEERMRAEHIFLAPWLREQRPAYMYVPVDAVFSDDEDEDFEDEEMEQDSSSSSSGLGNEEQPLDYSCSTLQAEVVISGHEDVEMG